MKAVIVLAFFCMVAAAMKPTPSVSELTKTIKATCKDVCKGEYYVK
jgi:hypothetical protein